MLLLLLLISSSVFAFELSEYPEKETSYLNVEVESLSAILGSDIAMFPVFFVDIRTEAGRLNISEEIYAKTCSDAYSKLKPSPVVHALKGFKDMVEYMDKLNITDRFPSNWSERETILHSFITNKRVALKRLAANALPETAKFIRNAERHLLEVIFGQRLPRLADYWTEGVRKIAREYNKLSKESKKDLERTFCARNAFNWINAASAVNFDTRTLKQGDGKSAKVLVPFFDFMNVTSAFSEEVELNVEELVKGSSYLSTFPIEEVKEKFRERAAQINVLAQDYVDTCAKSISIMKLSEKEKADFGISSNTTKNEKLVIDDMLEMIEINRKAILKYLTTPLARSTFIRERFPHLYSQARQAIDAIESEIILGNRPIINRPPLVAYNGERFEDLPNYSILDDYSFRSYGRQFEQVYCLQSTLETILEREVDFGVTHAFRGY